MARSRSLYPEFGVDRLLSQQGYRWASLIKAVRQLPVSDPHVMALTITFRRLRRAANLNRDLCHDPLCAACAAEVIAHFEGSEQELLSLYRSHLSEVTEALTAIRGQRRAAVAFSNSAAA